MSYVEIISKLEEILESKAAHYSTISFNQRIAEEQGDDSFGGMQRELNALSDETDIIEETIRIIEDLEDERSIY